MIFLIAELAVSLTKGICLLMAFLVFDSFTSNFQEKLFKEVAGFDLVVRMVGIGGAKLSHGGEHYSNKNWWIGGAMTIVKT